MKYIEEIKYGQIFLLNNDFFVLSSTYKIDNKKQYKYMCVQISTGSIHWLRANEIIDDVPVFYQDRDNIIHPIESLNNEKT